MAAGIGCPEMEQGYFLVFLGSLVEGDATLMAAAFLTRRGHLDFSGVLFTAALASTLGNEAVYHLARTRSRTYFERKVASHPKYAPVQRWIRDRSKILLLCSRYVFGFRWAIPAACGLTGMKPLTFLMLNLIGAVLWVIPLGVLGYAFGSIIERFWTGMRHYEWHIALAMLAVGWILIAFYDPELRMVASAAGHTRRFAIAEAARLRRFAKMPLLRRWRNRRRPSIPREPSG